MQYPPFSNIQHWSVQGGGGVLVAAPKESQLDVAREIYHHSNGPAVSAVRDCRESWPPGMLGKNMLVLSPPQF